MYDYITHNCNLGLFLSSQRIPSVRYANVQIVTMLQALTERFVDKLKEDAGWSASRSPPPEMVGDSTWEGGENPSRSVEGKRGKQARKSEHKTCRHCSRLSKNLAH